MAYITQDELDTIFTDDAVNDLLTDNDSVIAGRFTEAEASAAATIDGKIGRRYSTPVDLATDTRASAMIKRWTAILTVANLFQGRIFSVQGFQDDFDNVHADLKEVRDGSMEIPGLAMRGTTKAFSTTAGARRTHRRQLTDADGTNVGDDGAMDPW